MRKDLKINQPNICSIHASTPRISTDVSGAYQLEKIKIQPPGLTEIAGRRWNIIVSTMITRGCGLFIEINWRSASLHMWKLFKETLNIYHFTK